MPAPLGLFALQELLVDPDVLVVAADPELANGPLALADPARVPLVDHRRCRGLVRVEAELRAPGVEPEVPFRSEVSATIQALAGGGVGAPALPALAVGLANDRIVVRELIALAPRRLALARQAGRYHSAAAKAFWAEAVATCAAPEPSLPLEVVSA